MKSVNRPFLAILMSFLISAGVGPAAHSDVSLIDVGLVGGAATVGVSALYGGYKACEALLAKVKGTNVSKGPVSPTVRAKKINWLAAIIRSQIENTPQVNRSLDFLVSVNPHEYDRQELDLAGYQRWLVNTFGRHASALSLKHLEVGHQRAHEHDPEHFLTVVRSGKSWKNWAFPYDTHWPITVGLVDQDGGGFGKTFNPRVLVDFVTLDNIDGSQTNALQENDILMVAFGAKKPIDKDGQIVIEIDPEHINGAIELAKASIQTFENTPRITVERMDLFKEIQFSKLVKGNLASVVLRIKGARTNEEYIHANLALLNAIGDAAKANKQYGYKDKATYMAYLAQTLKRATKGK